MVMNSHELMVHLAIWPNVALLLIVAAAFCQNPFSARWDAEFMVPVTVPTTDEEADGKHRPEPSTKDTIAS